VAPVHVYRFVNSKRRVAAAIDDVAAAAEVERAAAAAAAWEDEDPSRRGEGIIKGSDSPLLVLASSRPELRAAAEAGAKKHGLMLCDFWAPLLAPVWSCAGIDAATATGKGVSDDPTTTSISSAVHHRRGAIRNEDGLATAAAGAGAGAGTGAEASSAAGTARWAGAAGQAGAEAGATGSAAAAMKKEKGVVAQKGCPRTPIARPPPRGLVPLSADFFRVMEVGLSLPGVRMVYMDHTDCLSSIAGLTAP
jgi:hypothetical protein